MYDHDWTPKQNENWRKAHLAQIWAKAGMFGAVGLATLIFALSSWR